MELAVRKGSDRFVPVGRYRELENRLKAKSDQWEKIPSAVVSCFDKSTRILPFVLYDKYVFPNGARSVAGSLHNAGFRNTRALFQLWNQNFLPSEARLGGKPLEMLMVSTMALHSERAREMIRNAWTMGKDRPLIMVGGPKTWYEPYHMWPMKGRVDGVDVPIAPDVVVTGEQFVLLDLLNVIADYYHPGGTLLAAFERARRDGALESVPGLVYLDPHSDLGNPVLVDTGLQRLMQCLDELPGETVGLSLLEPPHRGKGLSAAPLSDDKVGRHCRITSLLLTQGCKFNCHYCPIPALNQKSWRFRSPEVVAREFLQMYERFHIRYYFGADDNFFNHRDTAQGMLEAIAATKTGRHALGSKIRWATEATQFDTFKNRDLLPLARQAGLHSIWFGIEDLAAELINKGQKPEVTVQLFKEMHQHKICPMAMMMYYDGQPFNSPGKLQGLGNQIRFLRNAGAISVQVTVHTPAPGSREYEKTYESGQVIEKLDDYTVRTAEIDGNYVIVAGKEKLWKRQLKLLGGYFTFYNPLNLMRALLPDGSPLWKRRFGYQIAGMYGLTVTAVRMMPYLWRLMTSRPKFHTQPPPQSTVPVRLIENGFARYPQGPAVVKSGPGLTSARMDHHAVDSPPNALSGCSSVPEYQKRSA